MVDREGIGGRGLWSPTDVARRAVARSHDNVVAAWEEIQLGDAAETSQGLRLLEYWRIVYKHGGTFAMQNWGFCNGQTIAISQNPTLYNLIGTTYGGDGVNTFVLPNFQSSIPVHMGTGLGLSPYVIGQAGGAEAISLTAQTMPTHNHPLFATSSAANSLNISTTSLPGDTTGPLGVKFYSVQGGDTTPGQLAATSVGLAGASQPHENRMPALCVSFVIAFYGVYPSQN